jgi:hypothetical protein
MTHPKPLPDNERVRALLKSMTESQQCLCRLADSVDGGQGIPEDVTDWLVFFEEASEQLPAGHLDFIRAKFKEADNIKTQFFKALFGEDCDESLVVVTDELMIYNPENGPTEIFGLHVSVSCF